MSWEILKSGVRQDHRGRLYRTAINSRGQQDIIYVQPDPNAEPARTIPVPQEQPQAKPFPKQITTGYGSEMRRPVLHLPTRQHTIICRVNGSNEVRKLTFDNDSAGFERVLSVWFEWDYHQLYHKEIT
jgi:hypothetical protein